MLYKYGLDNPIIKPNHVRTRAWRRYIQSKKIKYRLINDSRYRLTPARFWSMGYNVSGLEYGDVTWVDLLGGYDYHKAKTSFSHRRSRYDDGGYKRTSFKNETIKILRDEGIIQ